MGSTLLIIINVKIDPLYNVYSRFYDSKKKREKNQKNEHVWTERRLSISLPGPDTRAFARFVLSFRPHALDGSRTAYLSRTANECRWTRFMTPIDRSLYRPKKWSLGPRLQLVAERRETWEYLFFFGMRNHYSKYEITKGSCSPASCRGERVEALSFVSFSRNYYVIVDSPGEIAAIIDRGDNVG